MVGGGVRKGPAEAGFERNLAAASVPTPDC